MLHDVLTAQPVPDDVIVVPATRRDVPALAVDIDGQSADVTVLSFHGGKFARGSAQASVGLAA